MRTRSPELPAEVRDHLTSSGKIESRLHRLEEIDLASATTPTGRYRLEGLQKFVDQDREARPEIRRLERLIDELLDSHGTTLRDEVGIGPIAAATLVCEVGDPKVGALVIRERRQSLMGTLASLLTLSCWRRGESCRRQLRGARGRVREH